MTGDLAISWRINLAFLASWRSFTSILAAPLLALAIAGCDKSPDSKSAAVDPTYPAAPAKVEHVGTIGGRVLFSGLAPQLPRLNTSGDPHCQMLHPDGLPDESVVVAADGGVANVFVYLKDAPRSDGGLREPAMIDQVGCQYVPHVVAVQINQPLRVKSSDPVFHNIHILAMTNPAMNMSETGPGEQTVRFASPEMIHVRCDVHPWMKAVIGVFDSPCFAVTDTSGNFEIHNIPPGEYTLAAWHERFGELTRKITVGPDGSVRGDFTYAP
jgi:hypothetical protein